MKTTNTYFLEVIAFLIMFLGNCEMNAQSITSFTPASGPVGTSVVIGGSGFNSTPSNNVVFFGATMANVTAASATSLTVTVPQGASYQYITATNLTTHLTAYSSSPFIVTGGCNGTPGFTTASPAQGGSHNVEICDIDADGKADLVIPDYFNNTINITRNTSTPGSISFAPQIAIPWAAGGQPNEVSLGDFDGDGKPDVAVGGNGGGLFVSVYRNTSSPGTISFAARQDFTASNGQGNGNRIADIDGDGKPDLLSVHWSGNCLWVLRNTGTGAGIISFAPGVSFGTTSQPHKIDVGDLDGDGKADVVITAFTSNTMSIFRNTSTPGNISFGTRQDFSPGTVPYFVHLGDLDGDGKADIAVVNRDVATLAIYRSTSTPGTISMAPRQTFPTPAGTMTHYGLAMGDLDGDGKPDIVTCNYTLNVTSIFINTGTPGTISFATRLDVPSGVSYDAGIDDFDGDNRPDIAVTNSGSTVSILQNTCTVSIPPVAGFKSNDSSVCANDCILFTDLSNNATTLQWIFPGGSPASSTGQNPQVCYLTPGIYSVTLIASNAGGADTLRISNFINVQAAPPIPVITQAGTTLYCSTDPSYISYQWYIGSNMIAGATDTSIIITKSGNYNVEVSNANNCKIAVGINIILGLQNYMKDNSILLSPNPAKNQLTIHNAQFAIERIEIYNVLGQNVSDSLDDRRSLSEVEVDVSALPPGIYFVQLTGENIQSLGRFVKE